MIKKKWNIVIVGLIIAIYMHLANDGRHHWHEFRYVYASTFYSTDELMKGLFDPGPSPVRTERQVAEWYSTELFHIYILKNIIKYFGIDINNYRIIKSLYGAIIVLAFATLAIMCKNIGMSLFGSYAFFCLILLSPLSVYLGFKFLAEVPAILFAAIAITSFTLILRYYTLRYLLSIFSGICIALSTLSSTKIIFVFIGFFISFITILTSKKEIKETIFLCLVSVFTFLSLWYLGFKQLGGSIDIIISSISSFRNFTKQLPMWIFSIFNIGLFGMGLWILFPFAWYSTEDRLRKFFIVWLCLSSIPILIGAANFLEPRYLITCIIPFVGLASIGFEVISETTKNFDRKSVKLFPLICIISSVLIGGTATAQFFMPYELNENSLIEAVQSELDSSKSNIVLVPWNYSDYHFLHLLFPDKNIYLVQSATNSRGELIEDPMWTARYKNIYGERFLPDEKSLENLKNRKMVFIGWTIMPSIENLREFLQIIRVNKLASHIENANLMNHMTQSWLWENQKFFLEKKSRYGQYLVFEVKDRNIILKANEIKLTSSTNNILNVPIYGIFEFPIENSKNYINPFTDTKLAVTFFSPTNKIYNFFGFYDGDGNGGQHGNIWKVRYMPMETGVWKWKALFSDGAPGASGFFKCIRSSFPGPLRVDNENPRWLKQTNGKHFFPKWFYIGELLFMNEGVWQQQVEKLLVGNNYNMVSILFTQAEPLVKEGWNRNEYENPLFYPWLKNNKDVIWDKYDLRAWNKLDRVMKYLHDRHIYVYNFDGFFPNIPPHFPDDINKERLYLRYAIARIGIYWNLVHNITFEFSEIFSEFRLKRIGYYIKDIDPFGILLTVHDTQDYVSFTKNQPWLDLVNLQYDAGRAGSARVSNSFIQRSYIGKPVAATEMVWEGGGKLNGEQVRKGGWGILMAGGFFLYGEFFPLDLGEGKANPYLKIMYDFMERIPYWTMDPHNELVNHGNLCLANPGEEYVVYAENGESIKVDISDVKGQVKVEWLNPRIGLRISGKQSADCKICWYQNPSHDTEDWVLHIKKS